MKRKVLYASVWALVALIWMFFNHQGGMEGILSGEPLVKVLKTAYGTWENAAKGIIPAIAFFIVRYHYIKTEQSDEKKTDE